MNNFAMSPAKQSLSRLRDVSVVAAAVPSGGVSSGGPDYLLSGRAGRAGSNQPTAPPLGTAAATREATLTKQSLGNSNRNTKIRILIAALLGLYVAIPLPGLAQTGPADSLGPLEKVTLHVGKASLATEIAATPAQQERGLMYVTKMPDNDGMIFLLPKITTATFWMKNTLIPLSIAFIDKEGVILEIHDMKAMDETITRSDSNKVACALETNLHWFALNGIKPGDKIEPAPATLGKTTAPAIDDLHQAIDNSK